MNERICAIAMIAVLAPVGLAGAEGVSDEQLQTAESWLTGALQDSQRLPTVLNALLLTEDEAAAPLLAALARNGDKTLRMMAVEMAGRLDGKEATAILLERLETDKQMAIRSNALIQLIRRKTIGDERLRAALEIEDEEVRMNAADALIQAGKGDWTKSTCQWLAESGDPGTAVFGHMALLGLGDRRQIAPLRKALVDDKPASAILIRTMEQVRMQKVTDALPLVEYLCGAEQTTPVRVRAWQARLALKPDDAGGLAEAITQADNPLLQVNLLRLLCEQESAGKHLPAMAASQSQIVSRIAAFEIARASGKDAEAALSELLGLGHPMVVEYVLHRMGQDVQAKRPVDPYAKPVLAFVHDAKLDSYRMGRQHELVARAVELLADSGAADATKGLWDILRGKYTTLQRVTAGALYRADSDQAIALIGHLLKSPYSELRNYAAFVLARSGDANALDVLLEIQAKPKTTGPDVQALANWYIVRLSGKSQQAVAALADSVK